MAEFQHNRIRARLLDEVSPRIDVTDVVDKSPAEQETYKLTRSIAAAALQIEASASAEIAASSIVDGFGDNGIDAIFYEISTRTLFLVQSKWSQTHNSSIDLAGVLKFLTGVSDLLSQKKAKFSEKIQKQWNLISDALDNAARIRLVIAYPGSEKIDQSIQERIDEFVVGQNDTSDTFSSTTVSQKELFQHFASEAAPPQIDLMVPLVQYGRVEAPLFAVYGQVSAVEVSKWYKEHGNKLFAGNIRHFVGFTSDVNAEISKTLTDRPESFWYFNNGITILAQDIVRRPGPTDKSIGLFDCKSVTVVNGAQTVGTIGRSKLLADSSAVVQARIILVEDPDAAIGRTITRASNTQNRIDARNFVALDPVQEKVRSELIFDGVVYEYREGEPLEITPTSFEFLDAIATLACASSEISYVALAKGYIGGLYTDINSTPYKALFNPGTDPRKLWTLVQLARRIDKSVRSRFEEPSATERGILVHGNRFTLHCMFRQLEKLRPIVPGNMFTEDEIDEAANLVMHVTRDIIDAFYDGRYLAPLFKNVTKCTDIRTRLEMGPPAT